MKSTSHPHIVARESFGSNLVIQARPRYTDNAGRVPLRDSDRNPVLKPETAALSIVLTTLAVVTGLAAACWLLNR